MSVQVVCGLLLIALPILSDASFATLAALFDYPDVLRRRQCRDPAGLRGRR